MQQKIQNKKELASWVQSWINQLSHKQVILLNGPMGVGKTFVTHVLSDLLGAKEQSHSPSYAIHNKYQGTQTEIHHLDLYRLETEDELESTGFWDLFSLEKALIIIEWAERINWEWIPKDYDLMEIYMDFSDDSESTSRILKKEKKR